VITPAETAVKSVQLSNRLELPYVEQGDGAGSPILFVHAIADSWHAFERVLSHLPKSVRAIAVTQRGHGDASRPTSGYRPRDFAADLLAFMDALQLGAAVIVGGSSGGLVARRFAIDHPERTLGLVLMGSPFSLRDKPGAVEIWDVVSRLEDPIDAGWLREVTESIIVRPVPQSFIETLVRESLKVPARVWKATFEGLMEDESSEELDKIWAPTLILWGDRDTILPRSDQEAYATAIPRARLVIYPGAGHAFYWEEPQRVASDLVAFLEAIDH
jgi:non-heme chloroperoxidase